MDQYVVVEKHGSDDASLAEADETLSYKKQRVEPRVEPQQEAGQTEWTADIVTEGFVLVDSADAGGPPVPPPSPMQIDSCEGQQACIEPVEELIQKLQALKLGEDNDERYASRMDVVSAASWSGIPVLAEAMQTDSRHGSRCPVVSDSYRSPQLLSTRMDDVQVDIPHDSWLHIGLDLRMRDIDDDDDDDGDDDDDDDDAIYDFESGDGVSNGYSCQFTSRFPTLETFDRGYESPQNRLDSSSNDASDCEIRDLSDALSMLSLDMEPEPESEPGSWQPCRFPRPADALDRTLKAHRARRARARQMGLWWCRCAKAGAGKVCAKARRGLRTKRAHTAKMATVTAERVDKTQTRKAPRLPRFPWQFDYWAWMG